MHPDPFLLSGPKVIHIIVFYFNNYLYNKPLYFFFDLSKLLYDFELVIICYNIFKKTYKTILVMHPVARLSGVLSVQSQGPPVFRGP